MMLWLSGTVVCVVKVICGVESVLWLWLCATVRLFLGDRDNEHFSLGCVGYKFVSVY